MNSLRRRAAVVFPRFGFTRLVAVTSGQLSLEFLLKHRSSTIFPALLLILMNLHSVKERMHR